jgi:hypothetical protein
VFVKLTTTSLSGDFPAALVDENSVPLRVNVFTPLEYPVPPYTTVGFWYVVPLTVILMVAASN